MDEDTLKKVYRALIFSGLSDNQATNAINNILNSGIIFREQGDQDD
jgi:hypothetical protein